MTNDEFYKKWRHKLAGIALCGLVDDTKGPISRTTKALEIPDLVDSLLKEIYQDLCPPIPKTPAAPSPPVTRPAPPVSPARK
jgi:hypothetical protein